MVVGVVRSKWMMEESNPTTTLPDEIRRISEVAEEGPTQSVYRKVVVLVVAVAVVAVVVVVVVVGCPWWHLVPVWESILDLDLRGGCRWEENRIRLLGCSEVAVWRANDLEGVDEAGEEGGSSAWHARAFNRSTNCFALRCCAGTTT